MLPKSSSLESTINLESVGLFLNEFDITGAYLGVFSEAQLHHLLQEICRRKPYKQFRRMLVSTKSLRLRQRYFGRHIGEYKEEQRNQYRRYRFYEHSGFASKMVYQLMFMHLIASPLVRFGLPQEKEGQIAGEEVILKASRRPDIGAVLEDALNRFYQQARKKPFGAFNIQGLSELSELCSSIDFCQELAETRTDSAFAPTSLAI